MITSLLDTDLYKLTMGQAVLRHYDRLKVQYKFINRGGTEFPPGFALALRVEIQKMHEVGLTQAEREFLTARCGHYLREMYIDWLSGYRFNPDEVRVEQRGGKLFVTIEGPWYRTIYWEVPLMATISELYFRLTGQTPVGDWEQMAYHQGERLADEGVPFSEFGTRRRHSYAVHDRVLQQLILGGGMHLQGTSNVHLAMKYKLTPVGTHAHEWFMAFAAMYGYRNATREALEAWEREYTDSLGVALADTFTTPVFLRSFTAHYANLFKGVRQDSGDPYQFVDLIVKHYQHYGIDPMSKTVLFSDGLDYERAIDLFHYCQGVIQSPVAIGTKFTNNVGRKPLNMVIKMTGVQLPEEPGVWTGTVKLSDNYREKATGSPVDIRTAMRELHLS